MLCSQLDLFVTYTRGNKVIKLICLFSRVQYVVVVEIEKSEQRLHLTNRLWS